jgi:putative ubiquitin-RnfH superfamily antitoxin RatB of RatAB toxin-antitoxin module
MANECRVRVVVTYSPAPRQVRELPVEVAAGASVLQALQASGLLLEFPEIERRKPGVGIWGRKARLDQPVQDGDRIEVYRPLLVDPKLARLERFRKQGTRAAGLFASRRPGSKAGY